MSLQPLLTELDTINILKLAIVLSIVQLPHLLHRLCRVLILLLLPPSFRLPLHATMHPKLSLTPLYQAGPFAALERTAHTLVILCVVTQSTVSVNTNDILTIC